MVDLKIGRPHYKIEINGKLVMDLNSMERIQMKIL
jgi:hypothetical protein